MVSNHLQSAASSCSILTLHQGTSADNPSGFSFIFSLQTSESCKSRGCCNILLSEAGCYSAVPIRNRCDPSVKSNHAAYQFAITVSIPSTSIGIIVYSNQRRSSMELYDSEVCLSFKMPRKQTLQIVPWSTSAEIKSLSTISRLNTSMFYIRRSISLRLTVRQSTLR